MHARFLSKLNNNVTLLKNINLNLFNVHYVTISNNRKNPRTRDQNA